MKIPFLSNSADGRAHQPAHPMRQFAPEDRRTRVLVTLIGADTHLRNRVVARQQGHPRLRTIYVVTDPDIGPLRGSDAVIEHLPAAATVLRSPQTGDWFAYLQQRWLIIQTKWAPAVMLTEGQSFEQYLRECGALAQAPL